MVAVFEHAFEFCDCHAAASDGNNIARVLIPGNKLVEGACLGVVYSLRGLGIVQHRRENLFVHTKPCVSSLRLDQHGPPEKLGEPCGVLAM